MEDETRQKQLFLRKNIIERGYDPLPFTDYLSQQRENGHDIENWSLKDLEEVVNKYIEITPKPEISAVISDQYASEIDESNDEEEKHATKTELATEKDSNDKSPVEKSSTGSPVSILR
jgi:hypothetical protein